MSAAIRDTGLRADGMPVLEVTLDDGDLAVVLLSLGARLHDVRLKGVDHPLVIGAGDPAEYSGAMAYFGAIVGPVANRISGGAAMLDGVTDYFARNERDAVTLHSGPTGTHARNWDLDHASAREATFALSLRDGTGGFPGNRTVAARYTLSGEGTLGLRIAVTTDAPTWVNFASHAFWRLGPGPDLSGHMLRVPADSYLPTDAHALVTGEIAPVADSPFDFRAARAIGPGTAPRLDHNFCLARVRGEPRRALDLTGPDGLRLEVTTTEPGVQVFDAHPFGGRDAARDLTGQPVGAYCGLAIEPQGWPDAPNRPGFPSVRLDAGRAYEQVTRFRITRG